MKSALINDMSCYFYVTRLGNIQLIFVRAVNANRPGTRKLRDILGE